VAGRSADIQHTVSELATVLKAIPGIDVAAATIVGAIGLSLGGAVATEFSKSSASAVGFVVNLDGGNYGELQGQPVRTPYLMLYSEENEGVNDDALHVASGLEVSRYALRETKHLNLHDISMLYPILRWLRAVGPANSADDVPGRGVRG
jgi:hypothetical protein